MLRIKEKIQHFRFLQKNLGLRGAFIYKKEIKRSLKLKSKEHYHLASKNAEYPLICRAHSSDISVFHQIFFEKEYSCLDELVEVDLIVDLGANVGYSSAYFLSRFPQSQLICVEPDSSNFQILEQNLNPYKERVTLIKSGVWSHITGLTINEIPYRDGFEWTVQVRECRENEKPQMEAIDIGTILKQSGKSRISILKVDIEGAEAVVFNKNYESWLPYVDNIVIEIHDDSCFGKASDIVFQAISSCGNSFDVFNSGELTVFKASR